MVDTVSTRFVRLAKIRATKLDKATKILINNANKFETIVLGDALSIERTKVSVTNENDFYHVSSVNPYQPRMLWFAAHTVDAYLWLPLSLR